MVGGALAPTARGPVGTITRGTTGINRLRRSDRWLVHRPQVREALAAAGTPLVVDLGYGANPGTTFELADRLAPLRPDLQVLGLEIDPARVTEGRGRVRFGLGGFELAGTSPTLVRALNVLRQYPEDAVAPAWELMTSRLAPGGLILEGTCDEHGRRAAWVLLDTSGPRTFTLAWDPFDVERPSTLAARLPKALIHRNVPGEAVHALLEDADAAWERAAPQAVFGPRHRWRAALEQLAGRWPVEVPRRRLRDNILTVPWHVVAPNL